MSCPSATTTTHPLRRRCCHCHFDLDSGSTAQDDGGAAAAGSPAAPDAEIFPAKLLHEADEADKSGNGTTAVVLYKQGVAALLGLAEAGGTDKLSVESLREKARLYMDRAKVRGGSGQRQLIRVATWCLSVPPCLVG